MILYSDRVLGF